MTKRKLLLVAALLLTPTMALAVIPAIRVSGVQISAQSSSSVASSKQGLWVDSNNLLKFRRTDGTDFRLGSTVTAPTCAIQTNAGTGASCSILSGTDGAFELQIISGTGVAAGLWVIVTFNQAFAAKSYCTVNGANAAGAGDGTASGYSFYHDRSGSASASVANFSMGTILGSASTTFKWIVHCNG